MFYFKFNFTSNVGSLKKEKKGKKRKGRKKKEKASFRSKCIKLRNTTNFQE